DVSNALLKSLEEPRPGNVFVLLTPQRERLLPTLVSRSWVFTLAWPGEGPPPEGAQDLARHLVEYWRTGRGWFDQTQAKIAAPFALDFVNYLMARQRDAMTGRHTGQGGDPVADDLARLFDAAGLRRLDLALARAQEALSLSPSAVNPALVLDWVAASVKD
ncbi:MAG: DNA polymerase III subunit delta', partial [Desulfovibrionaceae bacterium]